MISVSLHQKYSDGSSWDSQIHKGLVCVNKQFQAIFCYLFLSLGTFLILLNHSH